MQAGWSALLFAAHSGYTATVDALAQLGADLDSADHVRAAAACGRRAKDPAAYRRMV
jgi:hypothetical protein